MVLLSGPCWQNSEYITALCMTYLQASIMNNLWPAVWDHVVKGERMKIFHAFDKDSTPPLHPTIYLCITGIDLLDIASVLLPMA